MLLYLIRCLLFIYTSCVFDILSLPRLYELIFAFYKLDTVAMHYSYVNSHNNTIIHSILIQTSRIFTITAWTYPLMIEYGFRGDLYQVSPEHKSITGCAITRKSIRAVSPMFSTPSSKSRFPITQFPAYSPARLYAHQKKYLQLTKAITNCMIIIHLILLSIPCHFCCIRQILSAINESLPVLRQILWSAFCIP